MSRFESRSTGLVSVQVVSSYSLFLVISEQAFSNSKTY